MARRLRKAAARGEVLGQDAAVELVLLQAQAMDEAWAPTVPPTPAFLF